MVNCGDLKKLKAIKLLKLNDFKLSTTVGNCGKLWGTTKYFLIQL